MMVARVSILPLRIVRSGTEIAASPSPPAPPFFTIFGPAEKSAGRDTGGSELFPGFSPTTTAFNSPGDVPVASIDGAFSTSGTATPVLPALSCRPLPPAGGASNGRYTLPRLVSTTWPGTSLFGPPPLAARPGEGSM